MLWRWMEMGGPVMWPLLMCSALLGAVLIERTWTLAIRGWLIGSALSESQARAHQRVLPFFTDVPPSLGLLGTVIGVVQSFHLTGSQTLAGPEVGKGLAIACMTTVFGLIIALVASVARYMLDWIMPQTKLNPSTNADPNTRQGAAT